MRVWSLLLGLMVIGCVYCNDSVKIHFPLEGGSQSVHLGPSDTLLVTFEGLLSTGYWWQLDKSNSDALTGTVTYDMLIREEAPPDNWNFNFSIAAQQQSKGMLVFFCSKPWDHATPPMSNATLTICVLC